MEAILARHLGHTGVGTFELTARIFNTQLDQVLDRCHLEKGSESPFKLADGKVHHCRELFHADFLREIPRQMIHRRPEILVRADHRSGTPGIPHRPRNSNDLSRAIMEGSLTRKIPVQDTFPNVAQGKQRTAMFTLGEPGAKSSEPDHEKLTFHTAGRDFRLTDLHGKVVKAILA